MTERGAATAPAPPASSPGPATTPPAVTVIAVRLGDQLIPAERAACREAARADRAHWDDLYDTDHDD